MAELNRAMAYIVQELREQLAQSVSKRSTEVAEYQAAVAQLNAEHKIVVDAIDKDIHKMQGAIKALDGEKPKTARKTTSNVSHIGQRRKSGTATGCGISAEAVKPFVDHIKKVVAEKGGEIPTFTQQEIYRPMGVDQAKGSAAFRYLRQIEFLRRQGRTETRADLYAIMDADAYDRAMAAIEKTASEAQTEQVSDAA